MSGKRMIDHMLAGRIINPARNFSLFWDGGPPHSWPEEFRVNLKQAGDEIQMRSDKVMKAFDDIHVIDYSNVVESAVESDRKLHKWFNDEFHAEEKPPSEIETLWPTTKKDGVRALEAFAEKIGPVRPPFVATWMEAAIPPHLQDRLSVVLSHQKADHIGWSVCCLGDQILAGLYFQVRSGICGPITASRWDIDKDGLISSSVEVDVTGIYEWMPESVKKQIVLWGMDVLTTLFHALSFLNCKNVKQAKIEPNPKLSKRWRKRTGNSLSRYHVLTVGRTYNAKDEGVDTHREGSEGHRKAQHITRGHFRTYTPDKPLFGKWHGTLWVSAHVRGSKEEGVVTKGYKLAGAN